MKPSAPGLCLGEGSVGEAAVMIADHIVFPPMAPWMHRKLPSAKRGSLCGCCPTWAFFMADQGEWQPGADGVSSRPGLPSRLACVAADRVSDLG